MEAEGENIEANECVAVTKSSFKIQDDETEPLLTNTNTGLSWQLAVLFVSGEVLGGGVVAIGDALVNTGLYGFILIFVGLLGNAFMGKILAEVVSIATIKDNSNVRRRDTYTFAIQSALGKRWKIVTSILLNVICVCITTVYLLISTELFAIVAHDIFPVIAHQYFSFRVLLVVIAVCLIPVMLLGTPKEFWGVALFATLTTVLACCIAIIILWIDAPKHLDVIPKREVTTFSFFYGFGTIFFGFCGVPFFPNIQADLKDPSQFSKSIFFGYVIIILTYIPIAVTGYLILGDGIKENIVYNLFSLDIIRNGGKHYMVYKVLSYLVLLLLSGHFIFAYNLIFNSSAQEMEEYLKIPRGFCWQRCLIRIGLVVLTLILAQVIPNFNIILSFAGGTLLTVLSFQLPALAYFKVKDTITWYTKLVLVSIITIGCVGTVGSIYVAIINVIHLYK